MLAMDVEQILTKVTQLLGGGGTAIDPSAAFAGEVYGSPKQ